MKYGWRPSLPDFRDKIAVPPETILTEVDPRAAMPAVFNQLQLGSCTANAVAAAVEYDNHLDGRPLTGNRPSRLFLYYMERMIEGSLSQGDCGAVGRDGFKALTNYGWVPERKWMYYPSKFEVDPPSGLWQDALANKLTKPYASVPQDVDSIKAVLSNGQTVAFGFTVYESFESYQVETSGIVPMPSSGESTLGGHEVLAIGYLAEYPQHVLCRNSWGAGWGLKGYFLFPWSYLTSSSLASDLRTIVRATT